MERWADPGRGAGRFSLSFSRSAPSPCPNLENLLDTRYYATSQGHDNIMPGAPRTLRISLSAGR